MIDAVFPALLRYWRMARGLSQNDLAAVADVSARHLSFLETGRAKPSRDMVLRLGGSLALGLRDQNALLVAAGFAETFREPPAGDMDPTVQRALDRMMAQQEPYPLVVFDRHYDLRMSNRAAQRLMSALLGSRANAERNAMKLLFDPALLRPFVVDWPNVARAMLVRLQRETLDRRRDEGLLRLMSQLCAYEGVPAQWRTPDLALPSEATLQLAFTFGGQTFAFLTTLTVFQAPQNPALEELKIESYFPLDDATDAMCRGLAELG